MKHIIEPGCEDDLMIDKKDRNPEKASKKDSNPFKQLYKRIGIP